MRAAVLTVICSSLGLAAFIVPASAQGVGLDGLHDKRQEGSRICMADHFHDGSGNGKTRKAAESDAARAWSDFTAWEYGGAWGSFGNAVGKSVSCGLTGGGWGCDVNARPCRR